jgi:hypothetical protein
MFIKTFSLPVATGNPSDIREVRDKSELEKQLTAIYEEIEAGQGEIIGREWLPLVYNLRNFPGWQLPVLVVKFPGDPTNVGTD